MPRLEYPKYQPDGFALDLLTEEEARVVANKVAALALPHVAAFDRLLHDAGVWSSEVVADFASKVYRGMFPSVVQAFQRQPRRQS